MGYTITLAAGTILFIISLLLLRNSILFIQENEKTIAKVIRLDPVKDSDGITYLPIFKFVTITKQEIIYKHFASSSPPAFAVGEEANIVYNASNPADAKLLTYFGAFGWSVILLAIAMPLIVIGGGYYVAMQFLK